MVTFSVGRVTRLSLRNRELGEAVATIDAHAVGTVLNVTPSPSGTRPAFSSGAFEPSVLRGRCRAPPPSRSRTYLLGGSDATACRCSRWFGAAHRLCGSRQYSGRPLSMGDLSACPISAPSFQGQRPPQLPRQGCGSARRPRHARHEPHVWTPVVRTSLVAEAPWGGRCDTFREAGGSFHECAAR